MLPRQEERETVYCICVESIAQAGSCDAIQEYTDDRRGHIK